jgi:hypothetical protein
MIRDKALRDRAEMDCLLVLFGDVSAGLEGRFALFEEVNLFQSEAIAIKLCGQDTEGQ